MVRSIYRKAVVLVCRIGHDCNLQDMGHEAHVCMLDQPSRCSDQLPLEDKFNELKVTSNIRKINNCYQSKLFISMEKSHGFVFQVYVVPYWTAPCV